MVLKSDNLYSILLKAKSEANLHDLTYANKKCLIEIKIHHKNTR